MEATNVKVTKMYKDRIFRMIYKDGNHFLELYNALNGTDYDKVNDLQVTTLENAIYIGMKNDVSYLLYDQLTLYEHQSTKNPNMPLRNLLYVSGIYSDLTKGENLYGSTLVKIARPAFIVFYNGKEYMPERSELRLSDAYEMEGEVNLELKVQVLNVNLGFNKELMEKCRTLHDYAVFVNKMRQYSEEFSYEEAAERAVAECIAEGILEEFLRKNRAEVISVSIFEYDEELHMRQEREAAMKTGIQKGIQKGQYLNLISQIKKKQVRGISSEKIAEETEERVELVQEILAVIEAHPEADAATIYDFWKKD